MYILIATLFMLLCWVVGVLIFINYGISQSQYGSSKVKLKYHILFILTLVVLFIGLPFMGFYLIV